MVVEHATVLQYRTAPTLDAVHLAGQRLVEMQLWSDAIDVRSMKKPEADVRARLRLGAAKRGLGRSGPSAAGDEGYERAANQTTLPPSEAILSTSTTQNTRGAGDAEGAARHHPP